MSSYSARRLNKILEVMPKGARYLEIGVETGHTFFEVMAAHKTAVDPYFQFDLEVAQASDPSIHYHQVPSDEFFKSKEKNLKYDLIFLDGLHTWDQTYRDFCNAILATHDHSVIMIDDIFPCDVFSCNRDQFEGTMMRQFMTGDSSNAWHGDTYKIIPLIQMFFPSLNYCTIISDGNPQTLVWRSTKTMAPGFNLIQDQGSLTMADLDYLWFLRNQEGYNPMEEKVALDLVCSNLID
jgi:hypothetical protein